MACALGVEQDCNECRMCGNGKGGKKMTNFERIKGMSVEELAELLERFEMGDIDYAVTFCDLCKDGGNTLNLDCNGCLRHWLESECDANC